MDELTLLIEARLEFLGTPARVHTAECEIWMLEHENCTGCQYVLGCCKYTAAQLAVLKPIVYSPQGRSLNIDAESDKVVEVIERILAAKSVEDVQSLI